MMKLGWMGRDLIASVCDAKHCEADGMGSDDMRRDAMGLDFFNDGWGGSVMAGCSSAFDDGAVFR